MIHLAFILMYLYSFICVRFSGYIEINLNISNASVYCFNKNCRTTHTNDPFRGLFFFGFIFLMHNHRFLFQGTKKITCTCHALYLHGGRMCCLWLFCMYDTIKCDWFNRIPQFMYSNQSHLHRITHTLRRPFIDICNIFQYFSFKFSFIITFWI